MKLIDHNGRLFGKISVIDVLVILVVAALGAALYFKSNQPHTGSSVPTQTITYQVVVEAAPNYLKENIHVGDKVYDKAYESNGALGQIIEIQELPSTMMATYHDGTVKVTPVDDAVNLLLTIQGSGLVSERNYSINRVYDLGINSARTYYSQYAEFNVAVTHIF